MMPPSLVKLPHPEKIVARESSQPGMLARQKGRQLRYNPLTPVCRLDLTADDGADLPVEIDEGGVHGLKGTPLRGRDQLRDLGETRVDGRLAAHADRLATGSAPSRNSL